MEDVKLQEKIKAFLSVDHGYGYGYGLKAFCRKPVYRIDNTPTILTSIHNNVAKGFILMSDFSLRPCFVVKGNRMFAHGETLRDAMDALTEKMFEDMPEEERIAEFIKAHPDKGKAYPNQDLFDWHNRLTGSCEMGRKTFIQDKGLSLDGESTVTFFIELTKNAYNGSVIRNLEAAYNQ